MLAASHSVVIVTRSAFLFLRRASGRQHVFQTDCETAFKHKSGAAEISAAPLHIHTRFIKKGRSQLYGDRAYRAASLSQHTTLPCNARLNPNMFSDWPETHIIRGLSGIKIFYLTVEPFRPLRKEPFQVFHLGLVRPFDLDVRPHPSTQNVPPFEIASRSRSRLTVV